MASTAVKVQCQNVQLQEKDLERQHRRILLNGMQMVKHVDTTRIKERAENGWTTMESVTIQAAPTSMMAPMALEDSAQSSVHISLHTMGREEKERRLRNSLLT